MTTAIIKSDSDKKTLLLMQLAKEFGLTGRGTTFQGINGRGHDTWHWEESNR